MHPAAKVAPFVLSLALFRWIGVRSYGIYLWHWPVYMVTRPHVDVPITGLPLLVIRLTITIVLADLSFRYIEEPVRHGAIGRRLTAFRTSRGEPRRRIATGLVISGAAITLGVVVIAAGLISAEPGRAPEPALGGRGAHHAVHHGGGPPPPPRHRSWRSRWPIRARRSWPAGSP